jgi:hypothetical protein
LPGPTCAPTHRQGSIPVGRGARSAASFDQASVQSRAPAALRRLCPDAGSHRTLQSFSGGSRSRIRDDVAQQSDLMSLGVPRHQQLKIDPLQRAVVAPRVKVTLDRRVVRKITRQQPPLTTRPGDVEQRVDHRQQRRYGRRRGGAPGSRRGAAQGARRWPRAETLRRQQFRARLRLCRTGDARLARAQNRPSAITCTFIRLIRGQQRTRRRYSHRGTTASPRADVIKLNPWIAYNPPWRGEVWPAESRFSLYPGPAAPPIAAVGNLALRGRTNAGRCHRV